MDLIERGFMGFMMNSSTKRRNGLKAVRSAIFVLTAKTGVSGSQA